ncbi:LRR receptor-like serine/threonine-protein kinase [Tripterygium wilfordii]|uniref:LRR receptor-like serine/threonine-protein kinase n=1 Tax=Tripterygium wilfordii TaxID=458696 RepID=A0A7J7BYZ7_TRIWF|nr:LRR receptor-like serine/threonine-protein kinase FLS2 [Tripterygium wilfordii]KAF5727082.1 LRR receptor-like serine/threonine-protein kinase [Tripterygium wilfordii]
MNLSSLTHPSSSHILLLFLSIATLQGLKGTLGACHVDDEAGLLGFKSGISQDPSGMLSSWKPGTDCCKWAGVECRIGNRVTTISLYGQPDKPNSFLSGTISPSLVKVQNIDGIYFQDLRNMTGTFPDLLFGLPKLQFVYIRNSKLSGPIPEKIGKLAQLGALSLGGNRFTGSIPNSIAELTQLTQLDLSQNLLTGTIPVGIQHLKSLDLLYLHHNQLSGPIPDFFSSFTELRILKISYNKFTGQIPPSISSLAPTMTYLELGHNSLTGKIPDFLGQFKKLDTLDLSSNRLSGTVPKSFANLTKIFNLDLSRNLLVDPFPLMNVKGIESLDLSYNRLHLNQIPPWVATSPIIYSLKLAGCGLKLNLNDWKPTETYFYDYIDLSDNEISGSPVSLLNRTDYLVGFWASNNQLKFDMGKLRIVKTLKHLDLSKNLVYGNVPKEVTGLEKLNVSSNHLCGQLPATKFPASSFVGNDCLCGPPLSPCKKV